MASEVEKQLEGKIKRAVLEEKIRRAAREQVSLEMPPPELLLRRASDIPFEKIEHVFGGRLIKGAFQLMVGPGESGKGMSSVDIIARLSTGTPFPEDKAWRQPISVVVCVTEDSAGRVKARLQAAEANLNRIYFIDGPPAVRGGLIVPSPIAFDSDAGALLKKIRSVEAGALFLETTVEHLGDREGKKQWSTNNEAEVRRALAPLVAVCKEGSLIGWGVMHPRKSIEGGIDDSISGSAAFRNVGRSVMHVFRDPLEKDAKSPWRLLTVSKSNYMQHRPVTLRFRIEPWADNPEEGKVIWGIAGRTLIDERSAESIFRQMRDLNKVRTDYTVKDAESLLKRLLADGVVKTLAEIKAAADEEDLAWRNIQKAKENLGVESVKDGFPAVVVGWRLPEEKPEEL